MLHHVGRVAGRFDVLSAQVARHRTLVHPFEVEPHLTLLRHSRGDLNRKRSKLEDLSPSPLLRLREFMIPSGMRYHA